MLIWAGNTVYVKYWQNIIRLLDDSWKASYFPAVLFATRPPI